MKVQTAERFTASFDVRLRPARQEDLDKLEWFGQYKHFRDMFWRTFKEQQQNRRLMLLADVGGFPVGQIFIYFHHAGPGANHHHNQGYLYALRVMEPFQGQGIGTRLIREAERILRQRGYRWAVIAAAKDNVKARRLYERLGYQVFAQDAGRWEYTDHRGQRHQVHEPSWMLHKRL